MGNYPNARTDLQRFYFDDLSLGAHYDRNLMEVPPGACEDNSNFICINGQLRARGGYASVYPTAKTLPVVHLTLYRPMTGAAADLLRVDMDAPGLVYRVYRYTGGAWVDLVPGGVAWGGADAPVDSCVFKGVTYLNLGGTIYTYDGVSLVALGVADPSLPRILVAGDSRLFCANVVDIPTGIRVGYRLEWSDFLRGAVWGGGQGLGSSGFVDLPKDSSPITALYAANSTIMIFKAREIFLGVFTGMPKVYDVKPYINGPGCIAHQTLRTYRDGALVWLGDDNIYIGSPGQQPIPLGEKIKQRLMNSNSPYDVANFQKAVAFIDTYNHLYTLILPSKATGKVNLLLICNLRNGSWWEGALAGGVDVRSTISYREGNWTDTNLLGMADGTIWKYNLDATSDAGTTFSGYWKSGSLAVKAIFQGACEQASFQYARAQTVRTSALDHLNFTMHYSQGMERWATSSMGTQYFDGTDAQKLYTSDRHTAENFRIEIGFDSAATCPKIFRMDGGFVPQGVTR